MTIVELLSTLRHLNVKLWVEGDRLRYHAPQGKLTPELRAKLADRKAEVCSFLRRSSTPDSTTIPVRPTLSATQLPLSFAQQRLWFLQQLTPDNPVYNMSGAIDMRGPLNIPVLSQSLNEIVRRHASWRTTFTAVAGVPLQLIAPSLTLTLKHVCLAPLAPDQRQAEVTRLTMDDAQRPFDLAQGPLLRTTLLQLSDQEYRLLVTTHHIVFDAWSMGVFIQELAALYEAFVCGQPSPLSQMSIQYADFAHWQRQWFQGEVLATQLAYWKQQLGGTLPVLQLPSGCPLPSVATFQGARQPLAVPLRVTRSLKKLSRRQGVTLFMLLLAAFKLLLYRYSGQEDMLVGTAIAGRNRPEVEPLMGCFVNTLVLRTDLSGNPTFLTLLERVRDVALAAYAHQDLPFEKLVEELQPGRDLSHSPLFQVGFGFYNEPRPELELPGLTLNLKPIESGTAKLALTLLLRESDQGLTGWLEYQTDRLDAAMITRMVKHFQMLLSGIVANPKQRLTELPLLTAAERHQILGEWNETWTDYPEATCIHQLFEAQVERTPDAIALVFADEHLTYRELNVRANQLAHHLQALGVEPEVMVGLCMSRSPLMIVGLLGILKAGGAYVPLDPDYPGERLAFMLKDTRAPMVLTQDHLIANLPSLPQLHVLALDKGWAEIDKERQDNVVSGVKFDNLAYVIYTSGSTGKPKGVLVEHQGVCNLATAQIRTFDVQSHSHVLQFASLSFDASVSEIFMTLLAGGSLGLAPANALLPGPNLIQVLREQAITTVTLPPSVLAILPVADLPALQTIIVAGETCPPELVARWAPGRRFFNAYGPTETTVCATIARCEHSNQPPPIGHPIANVQAYILDPYLEPVPIGVPGELHIGSVGLARGYLNHPELTTAKFIHNPFWQSELKRMAYAQKLERKQFKYQKKLKRKQLKYERKLEDTADAKRAIYEQQLEFEKQKYANRTEQKELKYKRKTAQVWPPKDNHWLFTLPPVLNPGRQEMGAVRLYKTGDLARYRTDGNIEFLGRIDHQVKIRGFRIELGEIETVLQEHPAVQKAVVIAQGSPPEKQHLIAFIVCDPCPESLTQQLKATLKVTLPNYMTPTHMVCLTALPLTPNGKVDRHALLTRPLEEAQPSGAEVPPRDIIELQLTQIWEEVLDCRPIGVTDNFFDIGGHSLLAVRLMALIQEQFGRDLPLSVLFQGGTIEELAGILRTSPSTCAWSPLVGIQTAGGQQPFFCAHPLGGNVLGYVGLARCLSPDQPFYGLQAPGVDGQQQPYNQIGDLAAHYIEAVRHLQPSGPYLLGGHSFGGIVALEMAQQLQSQGEEIRLLAILDTPAPVHGDSSGDLSLEVIDDAQWLVKRARVLERFFGMSLSISWAALQQREPEDQLNYFLEQMQLAKLIPPDAGQQMIRRLLQVQKASHQALLSYVPQVYSGRITLLRVAEILAEDSCGVFTKNFRDRAFGWQELTTETVEVHELPGNHITMLTPPHVQVLADKLQSCLDRAQATVH